MGGVVGKKQQPPSTGGGGGGAHTTHQQQPEDISEGWWARSGCLHSSARKEAHVFETCDKTHENERPQYLDRFSCNSTIFIVLCLCSHFPHIIGEKDANSVSNSMRGLVIRKERPSADGIISTATQPQFMMLCFPSNSPTPGSDFAA